MSGPKVAGCRCEACVPMGNPFDGTAVNARMILCATCGNKRCPHATNHHNACTNSNDPGQAGSSYEQCSKFVRAIEPSPAPVQPQAEPVAEIIECSKMGQQTVKEIDGRWKFLDYGTKLYAGAAPVAQAEPDLLVAYEESIQDIADWAAYASDHFQEKHDLAGVLKSHRDRLAAMKGTP